MFGNWAGNDPRREQSFSFGAGSGTGSARYKGSIPIEMSGRNLFPRIGDLPYLLTMGPINPMRFAYAGSDFPTHDKEYF